MATVVSPTIDAQWSLADVVQHLGDIPLHRIRAVPPPGTASEDDVRTAEVRYGRLCELIDGILVEKTVGYWESTVAMELGRHLGDFVVPRGLGFISGEAGGMRILPRQVRMPDVAFVSRARLADCPEPTRPIPAVAPDLAVEVLSADNTPAEMRRKLYDYFAAGVRLVWYIDLRTRTAEVFTSPEERTVIDQAGTLDGGDVLPGFQLKLGDLLARVPAL